MKTQTLQVLCADCLLPISHSCPSEGRVYVVAGRDVSEGHTLATGQESRRTIVFEQYVDETGIDAARKRAAYLAQQGYGPTRIGRLVFIDDEQSTQEWIIAAFGDLINAIDTGVQTKHLKEVETKAARSYGREGIGLLAAARAALAALVALQPEVSDAETKA